MRLVLSTLATIAMACPASFAVVGFELPEVTIPVNGVDAVQGVFEVTVSADPSDLPAAVSTFNLDFSVGSADVELGPADRATDPLFPLGFPVVSPFSTPQRIQVSQDILDQIPDEAPLFDGAGLARIGYRIEPGVIGQFSLTLTPGVTNELLGFSSDIVLDLSDAGSITAILEGDYNRDGRVDAADYSVYRDSLNATVDPYAGADGNGDGVVDSQDLNVWRLAYGSEIAVGGPLTVPEPATLALALGSIALASAGVRGRD